jgi:signal transduction histidine kinase
LLARRAESPAQRRDLEAALDQGDQLLAMFAAVLRIAEIEGGDRRAGFAPLDLGALATEIGTMMRPVAEDSAHRIELERCDAAPIDGDRQLLSQLLINLIENGLRHTPSGTRIGIGVAVRDGRVNLTVRDDGPGIAADLRALALRRFGRLDRSRGGAGHGLGLALVEAIARLHGGDLLLDDARPGLAVIVSLPRA